MIPSLSASAPAAPVLAAAHPALAVLDPADGPGAHPQAALRKRIAVLRDGKTRLLAYVSSDHGHRSPAAVLGDLARYRRWYGIRDVVLGQTATGAGALGSYRRLAHKLRRHGAHLIVFDPGAVPARGYFSIANAIVTFAGPESAYAHARFPGWLRHIAPDRQLNLISGATTPGRARRVVGLARRRRVGLVFVTSATGADAFAGSPAYLAREADWLSRRG